MIEQNAFANGDLFAHELDTTGGRLGCPPSTTTWLKEGPAEYSSHLFVTEGWPRSFWGLVKDNQFVLEECHVQDLGFHPLSYADSEIYYCTRTTKERV